MAECVGCGFCCLKGICVAGYMRASGSQGGEIHPCPYLTWDEAAGRYWCELALQDERFKAVLYIGEGCSCGLNTWRQDVRRRD